MQGTGCVAQPTPPHCTACAHRHLSRRRMGWHQHAMAAAVLRAVPRPGGVGGACVGTANNMRVGRRGRPHAPVACTAPMLCDVYNWPCAKHPSLARHGCGGLAGSFCQQDNKAFWSVRGGPPAAGMPEAGRVSCTYNQGVAVRAIVPALVRLGAGVLFGVDLPLQPPAGAVTRGGSCTPRPARGRPRPHDMAAPHSLCFMLRARVQRPAVGAAN